MWFLSVIRRYTLRLEHGRDVVSQGVNKLIAYQNTVNAISETVREWKQSAYVRDTCDMKEKTNETM